MATIWCAARQGVTVNRHLPLPAGGIFAKSLPTRSWRGARSSAGEHYVDIVGVTGSIPVAPTTVLKARPREDKTSRESPAASVGGLPRAAKLVPRQTAEPVMSTHFAGFDPGTRKIGRPRVVSYISWGGQLTRPGTLTGRSALVPTIMNLVAWSGWIVSASGNGISTVAPVL